MLYDEIFKFIGQVVAQGGGAALIAYMIFRFLGQNWIENKFSVSLEKFKGIQAHELEEAKSKISLMMARTLKLHDKEYEVFPEVWAKLNEAKIALERSIRSIRQAPNFDSMTDNDFYKSLNQTDLSDREKELVRNSELKKRNKEYIRIMEWRDIQEAHSKFTQFHEFLQKIRIFLAPEIKTKLDLIDDAMWKTWVSKQLSYEDSKNFKRTEANRVFGENVKPLMEEIEQLVQIKLFPKE